MVSDHGSSRLDNPYRPFFFVGILAAIVGTSVWITHAIVGSAHPYPGRFHAHLMMGLFLMSFAMGFLMTALPRMTSSFRTRRYEFAFAATSLAWLGTFGLSDPSERNFFWGILLNVGFLVFFATRRIRYRQKNLPEFFPLVFWALLSALAGAVFFLSGSRVLGEHLFYLNFMLCLVLGVGMRLIPMLLGLPARNPKSAWIHFALGALVTAAVFLEELVHPSLGTTLRAVLVTATAILGWRLLTRGARSSGLTWGLRSSALSVVAGVWGLAIYPEFRLEALHVIYVMGFSLMTLMVASRVILAHGNWGVENELKNIFIKLAVFFVLLAGVTRVAAVFVPASYDQHLAYASASFILGLGIWSRYFLVRLFGNPSP